MRHREEHKVRHRVRHRMRHREEHRVRHRKQQSETLRTRRGAQALLSTQVSPAVSGISAVPGITCCFRYLALPAVSGVTCCSWHYLAFLLDQEQQRAVAAEQRQHPLHGLSGEMQPNQTAEDFCHELSLDTPAAERNIFHAASKVPLLQG